MANPKYYQQLHAEDNGTIVVAADAKGSFAFVCMQCKTLWEPKSIYPMGAVFGSDFKAYNPDATQESA